MAKIVTEYRVYETRGKVRRLFATYRHRADARDLCAIIHSTGGIGRKLEIVTVQVEENEEIF